MCKSTYIPWIMSWNSVMHNYFYFNKWIKMLLPSWSFFMPYQIICMHDRTSYGVVRGCIQPRGPCRLEAEFREWINGISLLPITAKTIYKFKLNLCDSHSRLAPGAQLEDMQDQMQLDHHHYILPPRRISLSFNEKLYFDCGEDTRKCRNELLYLS